LSSDSYSKIAESLTPYIIDIHEGVIADSFLFETDKKTGIIGHRKTNYIVLKSFPKTSWTNHYVMFFTDLEKKALAIFNN